MAALGLLAATLSVLALASAEAGPPRVVSLDFCADQFVLALSDRADILAVSPQADDAHSALRDRAEGLPQLRATAEDVLALQPDLIVRSYGGDARTLAFFERVGLTVHQIGFAGDFDGIRAALRDTANALGQTDRGETLIAAMDAQHAAAPRRNGTAALYLTPAGATTGSGTLIDATLAAAGLTNATPGAGWRSLPLEEIAQQSPDLVVTAYFEDLSAAPDGWAVASHPVFRRLIADTPRLDLDGAQISCGTWMLADAAADLRAAAESHAAP
jgi:iron complex transport system substrate-binding protein